MCNELMSYDCVPKHCPLFPSTHSHTHVHVHTHTRQYSHTHVHTCTCVCRPGASFDLHVIKTGNGRVFVRGARTQVDLMAADSQISIGDTSFVHVIDGVLRFSNIATDASVEGE